MRNALTLVTVPKIFTLQHRTQKIGLLNMTMKFVAHITMDPLYRKVTQNSIMERSAEQLDWRINGQTEGENLQVHSRSWNSRRIVFGVVCYRERQ